jgi:hypothetical protein
MTRLVMLVWYSRWRWRRSIRQLVEGDEEVVDSDRGNLGLGPGPVLM